MRAARSSSRARQHACVTERLGWVWVVVGAVVVISTTSQSTDALAPPTPPPPTLPPFETALQRGLVEKDEPKAAVASAAAADEVFILFANPATRR